MTIKIDKRLNMVMSVQTDSGEAFVHSTLVSYDVFKSNWLAISKAFAAIYGESLDMIAGPRVALYVLRQTAEEMGVGKYVEDSLIAEMRRLTNVMVPSPQGYKMMTLDDAAKHGGMDPREVDEVENALAFFTLASLMHKARELAGHLQGLGLWGARAESLNATEFMNSLPTSTPAANIGETVQALHIPS